MNADGLLSTIDLDCLNSSTKATLQAAGYDFNSSTKWLGYNFTTNARDQQSTNASDTATYNPITIPPECAYQTTAPTINSLAYFLSTYFNGTLSYGAEAIEGSSLMQQFFNAGNMSFDSINTTFTNVANSMTAETRQNGYANSSDPAVGLAYHNLTCVRVQWRWLMFPAVLVLLTIAFFTAMIVQTSSTPTTTSPSSSSPSSQHPNERDITTITTTTTSTTNHDYKTSVLPLMFHGLEAAATRHRFDESMGRTADMKRDAKKVFVRLSNSESGWKFVEVGRPGIEEEERDD